MGETPTDGAADMPGLEMSAMLLDTYELTMVESYLRRGMNETATFELFARKLSPHRNYLVAAGLEQALAFLENFHFSAQEIEWLRRSKRFDQTFLDRLAALRFTGQVNAAAEGTVLFGHEPIIQVTAALPEAQLVESRLLNLVHFQTLVASKASRSITAANGRPLIDFGLRRAHGAEAGVLAARAAYLVGFAGTSNVLAGARHGIPIFGTMAHSFVQAHDDEALAFEHFALDHPDNVVLLLDTYDTEAGARKVVDLFRRLGARAPRIRAVRIDSGDLAEHARRVRVILDEGGLRDVQIMASSGLDEAAITNSSARGTIDTFAPGTALVTSSDAPHLDCAYKLVEYAGRPRYKRSEGKVLWPGAKQVYRTLGPDGFIEQDRLTLAKETSAGEPLLIPVMRGGRRLHPPPSLETIRRHAAAQRATLSPLLRGLSPTDWSPLVVSPTIRSILG